MWGVCLCGHKQVCFMFQIYILKLVPNNFYIILLVYCSEIAMNDKLGNGLNKAWAIT